MFKLIYKGIVKPDFNLMILFSKLKEIIKNLELI